ncbi:uncharacterized protein LOC119744272 isoform X2 [Patiria miniata]|uniref:Uncharacterized protein n=1 Tax=Patiria miniata TaxID=46514 RepID=A0A914BKR9_PATMI|nr:uncharacterized protein LOC119744272 isoform X2 [Patiria miniata]
MSSNSSMSVGVCVKSSPLSTINCNTVNTAERSPTRRSTMKRRSQNAEIRTSFPDSVNAVGEGKENMEPFVEESDNEEDEEVFFGDITDMERFKMAKLRRKTQVFVANFRDVSSSGSGTDSLDESSSMHHSTSSQDSSVVISSSAEPESPASCNSSGETAAMHQHPKLSHLERMAPSSTDSPSVLAHRAAAKIQTWFRLTRQAQEYQGVMREVERLEAKTDDFIQKIRREKERIKQCSTPEQGGRLDTASSSPMVIVPSHRLHLVETSPQQDNDVTTLQQSLNPAQLSTDSTANVIFNATNDSESIDTTTSGSASFSPVKLDESISAQSEVPKADSESNCSAAEQESYDTPDRHVQGTYQSKTNASVESSLYSTPSFVQSGSASQVTSVSSAGTLYHAAYSKVASDVKAHAVSEEHFVGTPLEFRKTEHNATNSPFLQVEKSSASYPQRTPLRQLHTSGTLSSFPKVTYEQIQSPTVFSSPRLFPVTVQAVQPQQSVSSAALFSPLKISDHTPVQDYQHSETMMSQSFSAKVTESQKPQKEIEKENHNLAFDFDTRQPTARNADSVRQDLDYQARPCLDSFTASSTPLAALPVSPNISVLRSAQKVAIVTPNSPLLPNTSRSDSKSHSTRCEMEYKTMPIADEGPRQQLSTAQEKGPSRHFFPSPLVMTRDTPETTTQSVPVTHPTGRPDPSNASRLEAAYGGRPGITTSPFTGARSCESARRKVELLEQKRAELARLRAEKAELKQTLKTENEMCFAMKQEVKAALHSNTSQTNIPVHLLSLGCQGISSLTLTDQELDIVTRLHTIRNSHHDNLQGVAASPMVTPIPHKGSLHLQWHSDLVTEVHCLSSPGHPVRVARPILANQDVCKARRVPAARTASPAQRVPTRQDKSRYPSGYTRTPREKLAF